MAARSSNFQRGDTLIEVIIGITIFSMVAVGSLAMMNYGVSMSQKSLEVSLARNQIDSQAEMVRYLHTRAQIEKNDSYRQTWSSLPKGVAGVNMQDSGACPSSFTDGAFALRLSGGNIVRVNEYAPAESYPRIVDEAAHGISMRLVKVQNGNAYDAHIQTCWYPVGSDRPTTTGTIVRLYDPES